MNLPDEVKKQIEAKALSDELSEKDKRIKVLEGKLASVALMLKQSGNRYQFCEIKKLLK